MATKAKAKPTAKTKAAAKPKPSKGAPDGDLLAAIFADPDSNAARQVYADHLLEQGDPRGEFIQLQLTLAGLPETDPRFAEMFGRMKQLEAKHAKAWLAPFREHIRRWRFWRGFPYVVTTSVELWCKGASAILAAAPNIYVNLEGLKKAHLPALSKTPLGRLGRLGLSDSRIDAAQLAEIASWPTLAGLRDLGISGNVFKETGARALAGSPHVGSLHTLDLGQCHVGDDGLVAIAASPHLTGLRGLDLSAGGIGPAGMAALAKSSTLTNLESITLYSNPIGDAGAASLASASSLSKLTRLRCGGSMGITAAGIKALVESKALKALSCVDLDDGDAKSKAALAKRFTGGPADWKSMLVTSDGTRSGRIPHAFYR